MNKKVYVAPAVDAIVTEVLMQSALAPQSVGGPQPDYTFDE